MSTQPNNTNQQQPPANTPIARIRAESVTVSIWENEGQFPGRPMHSVHLQRSYRVTDEVTGETTWHNTSSIPLGQVLAAAKALEGAYTWICQRRNQLAAKAQAPADTQAAQPRPAQPAPKPHGNGNGLVPVQLEDGTTAWVPPAVAAHIQTVEDRAEMYAHSAERGR